MLFCDMFNARWLFSDIILVLITCGIFGGLVV